MRAPEEGAATIAPDRAARFAQSVLDWYDANGRKDLPWQRDPTPYRVWISEIMLQQTQVGTVIPYFQAFTTRFPDVQALAEARLDEVLHLWSGLGYYARARNLRRAAQAIMREHGGMFPDEFEDVLRLPGIGRSTAGAILALASGQRHPILDGNVKRVLSRSYGIAGDPGKGAVERTLWAIADACTPSERMAEYTQAIMDLGATVCTRARPACLLCPVAAECEARSRGTQAEFPSARRRAARPRRTAWLVIAMRGPCMVLLQRRPPTGVWGGLWGLPEFPTRAHAEQWVGERISGPSSTARIEPLRHAFSHFDYDMQPLILRCIGKAASLRDDERFRWYDVRRPMKVGLPKPIATLIARAQQEATR